MIKVNKCNTIDVSYYTDIRYMIKLLNNIESKYKSHGDKGLARRCNEDIKKLSSEWRRYTHSHYKCAPIGTFFKIKNSFLRIFLGSCCETMDRKRGDIVIDDIKLLINKFIYENGAVQISEDLLTYSYKIYNDYGDLAILVKRNLDKDYTIIKISNIIYVCEQGTKNVIHIINCDKDKITYNESKYIWIYNEVSRTINNININITSKNKLFDEYIYKLSNTINDGEDKKEIISLIKSTVSKHNIELLERYFKSNELEKFETVARRVYNDAFIKLIDYKLEAHMDISEQSKDYYYKLTKKKINNAKHTEELYRHPVTRGILKNNKGDVIDGGCNRNNQTSINIKINDNDFEMLCKKFNIINPNQSQLNAIIEEVLKLKFESNEQYSLSNKARLTVLYHRDKRQQSKVSNYKSCYIPCEYNAYITEIQRRNYKTENFKNSKTFVLSVILHEYIGYV